MGKIIRLDAHVADLIAAGEVVERPASVIKELMENAIDAGADKITVELRGGGMTYMRVTDNGCGIADEDAETAFLRHATSKLRDEKGLEAISTLGFRGEALAAVASVARLELITRETGAPEGTSLGLDGGAVVSRSAAGCPEGTTLIVRDLFYNTPARHKFMKSDRAEGAAVSAQVTGCALSHPEISVRYIRDGREECHTPGDGRMDSCIYSLFGRDFMNGLLRAAAEDGDVAVTGFVSTPDAARGNRSSQYFFVNGRAVKSKTLQAGLEQAYRNRLFTGRYPSCVLYITLRHCDVDVNVHPTKIEVKFAREHQVFDGVYYAALSALDGLTARPAGLPADGVSAEETTPAEETAPGFSGEPFPDTIPVNGTFPAEDENAGRGRAGHISGDKRASGHPSAPRSPSGFGSGAADISFKSGQALYGRGPVPPDNSFAPVRDGTRTAYRTYAPAYPEAEQLRMEAGSESDGLPYRVIGEAMDTYILAERGDSLWLIDKHAAHERIHFDRLRREKQGTMSHALLQPVICTPGGEDAALLLEHAPVFEKLGFLLEQFGEDAIAVRQIPSDISDGDIDAVLGEAAQLLRRGGKPDDGFLYDALLHTVACKAAVKAGKSASGPEMEALAARVLSGEVKYCPHGRPVAVELTKSALDKSFKRI